MKKILCLLMIMTLALTMLLVACNQVDDPSHEQSSQQGSEPNGEHNSEQSSEQNSEVETPPLEFSEGLDFVSNGDGTCYVSGRGTCSDMDIVIPRTSPDGDSVTSIGTEAFADCTDLIGVIIPDSVTFIWPGAFSNCFGLSSITIPHGVTSVGSRAFKDCTSLTSIIIPDSVTSIGDYAFFGCTGLTSIAIPDSVTSIGDYAFSGCTGLKSITLPICAADMRDFSSLEEIYYQGTIAEWLDQGGRSRGEACEIHCSDGDIPLELRVALVGVSFVDLSSPYVCLGQMHIPYLEEVAMLAEYAKNYDAFLKTGISYEDYEQYQDAQEGTEEYELYQLYLDYRTALSRYKTSLNRRKNDLAKMNNYLSQIKEQNETLDLNVIHQYVSECLPVLEQWYGFEVKYEEGRDGDLTAITNWDDFPKWLKSEMTNYCIPFVSGEYPTTVEEAQDMFDSAVSALVEPGYVTQEEIEQFLSDQSQD